MALLRDSDGNDLTVISSSTDGSKRLGVSAKIFGGITGLTGSIKWDKSTDDVSISNSSYTTFWDKNEPGALYGMVFKLDNEQMNFKLVVDDVEIFNIHLKDELKGEFDLNNNSENFPPYITEYSSKKYKFKPPEPIVFNKISLQLKADLNNKDLEGYIITWRSA